MKTKGAILWGVGEAWSVEEIEVGDPRAGEVTVELAASGLCHSDEHLVTGGTPVASWPVIGGHEGAGIVTKVGPGVTGLKEGDHVVTAFIPACGQCPPCSNGHQNLCTSAPGCSPAAPSATTPSGCRPADRTPSRCVCWARSPPTSQCTRRRW